MKNLPSHELIECFFNHYVVMVVSQGNIATLCPYYYRQTFVTSVMTIALLILCTDKYTISALGTSRDHVGSEQRRPFLSKK